MTVGTTSPVNKNLLIWKGTLPAPIDSSVQYAEGAKDNGRTIWTVSTVPTPNAEQYTVIAMIWFDSQKPNG